MTAKCSFSFRNDKILQTQLGDGVFLRTERVGPAVARVFFVDEGFAETQVPNNFRIVDHSNNDTNALQFPGREEFFLGWADNYSMFLGDVLIFKLINQRQWAIQGPADRSVIAIDA
jgi:hypothetical protein